MKKSRQSGVSVPAATDELTVARTLGLRTISDILRERLTRAGAALDSLVRVPAAGTHS